MKLLSAFLLSTFITTIWSYQPRSQDADWSRSFDRHGWSECPNNFYISGMYRSGRGGTNGLNHIERVRCTQATSQSSQTCRVGNWWSSFDRKGWSTCQNGHFVRGFMRTGPNRAHPDALRELEEARCCRPNNGIVRFGHCMNHNVWSSWDNAGWFHCNKGYYLVGIWRNNAGCENLGCMEEFRCCQMIAVNPCTRNNGGCQHQCRNNGGTAVCSCKPGYKLHGKACVDRNECTDGSSKCAHGCKNTAGAFKCTCKQGFTLRADGKSCRAARNPCGRNKGGCAHKCSNRNGVAKCSCRKGFNLLPNGKSCTPFNVVTEGGVTYIDVPRKRCRSVSKQECTKISESRGIPLRQILNPNFNRFPPGCYHKTTSNVIYYNEKPSTKECTKKRVCICKPE